jgi:hypothetical protein
MELQCNDSGVGSQALSSARFAGGNWFPHDFGDLASAMANPAAPGDTNANVTLESRFDTTLLSNTVP